jgi:tetratricopeptide (TPR) repeat protein
MKLKMTRTQLVVSLFVLIINVFIPFERLSAINGESENYQELFDHALKITEDQPEEAVALLKNALSNINEKEAPQAASKAYFLLGEAYYYLDELDSTIINYQKAVDINISSGNDKTPEHINILGNLGYMYDVLDQKLIALDYYEKALKIAREIGQKDEIAANLANIAQIKTIQGYYNEALVYMEEAIAIDKEIGDESIIATDLNTIGRVYESWKMYDKAVDYLEQALEIDRRLKMDDKMAVRYNSLGLAYKGWGKYDKALGYFVKALQIDSNLKKEEKIALRKANIGSTYMEMQEPDKAIPFLEEGLAYFLDNQLPSYCATTLNDLGRCYLQQKDYGKAEKSFLQSAAISRENGMNRFLMNSLDYLSRLYRESGQFEKAYKSLHEFVTLNDSVFDAESQKKVAEFNAKYELDKRQQENELLRKDNELTKKRHTVVVLLFSLSALFLLALLLALLVRLKGNQNRRLRAEKENEKLKMDLEQRNRELTYNAMCIIKNNETVAKMAETIEEALASGEEPSDLTYLVRKLQHIERDKNWTEFEIRFTKTHQAFYDKLNARFPDLTPNEKKICAFLKLNMSTKDIASITHQSVHSLNVARTRLRKKLGIDQTDENLVNFLGSL